ncbi:MAG: HPr(Ser) kinase/phosphatase [Thermodesulfobacteriota bacterium]
MGVPVKEIFEDTKIAYLDFKLVAGHKGRGKDLVTPHIQKPGLLLTGLLDELHLDRIQIFGAAETGYVRGLEGEKLSRTLSVISSPEIPAIILTKGETPPESLVALCDEFAIPLYTTELTTSIVIEDFTKFLDDRLAPTVRLHGVLMDVLGMGILLTGKSGIGKSECALDLVASGYQLVADDVVILKKLPPATLIGTAADLIRYHMEIRGIGVINIQDLFGITAIREQKQLDLVVELVKWDPKGDYERLGFEDNTSEILGVDVPYFKIPVSPGRSVATIVEIAARNRILKIMGRHSGKTFEANLNAAIEGSARAGK